MPRRRLRDLVVVLPGITGSVLTRRGRPIWAPSHRLGARFLVTPGASAGRLELSDLADVDSGEVTATALVEDAHMVAGLVKVVGYSALVAAIKDNFDVVEAGDGVPGNLLRFPYDWRQDNRLTAQRLKEVVEPALAAWREHADVPGAKVVFLAHSMGGLVARYYLEVLDGRPDCRALITFGTPFRGSPQALAYLTSGYKRLNVDLTAAMRTFPSVHQLLPIYPMVNVGGMFRRVAEVAGLPGVDAARAADALAFHREIEDAVATNSAVRPDRYAVLPVVGTHQPTLQSAVFDGRTVTVGRALPDGVDPYFGDGDIDGDGTVPIVSAAPIELSDVYHDVHHPQRHSALQAGRSVLGDVVGKLKKMQSLDLAKLRGAEPSDAASMPALTLEVDDAYADDEPVVLHARWSGSDRSGVAVTARVTGPDGEARPPLPMTPTERGWRLELTDPAAGVHRVVATAGGPGTAGAEPVQDLFEVAGGVGAP